MKFKWHQLVLGAFVITLSVLRPAVPSAQAPQPASGIIADEWIVTLVPDADPGSEAPDLAKAHGGQVDHVYENVLHGFSFRGSAQAVAALARNPRVASVVPNRAVRAVAETLPTGVRRIDASHPTAVDAHDLGFTGVGITVAILDTGIQANHEDLVGRVVPSLGKNCVDPTLDPADGHGHGTHVAGTIAGVAGNGIGVVGVAPSASLAAVKVLDDGGNGSWASVICGIDWVTAHANDIRVANMSLGGGGSDTGCNDGGLHKAVCDSVAAGVVYAVAAGNETSNASTSVPAAYPEVITVSALNDSDGEPGGDSRADFSNFGSIVDVIAPGVNILSTYYGNRYGYLSGTSMATPHVAGVAALVRSANPALTPAQVEDLLKSTGECPNASQNTGGGTCAGQGVWGGDPDGIPEPLISALAAAEAAAGASTNTPPVGNNVSAGGPEDNAIAWTPSVSDANGDTLACSIATAPANGAATVNSDCSTGSYTPGANFNGVVTFTYRVSDGSASDTGTITMTVNAVNDAPVANNDTYSVAKGGTLNVSVPGLLGNDGDVDGNPLFAVLVSGPANGGLTLNANGSFSYTHNGGVSTSDGFTYKLNDGTADGNIATVGITVTSAPAPVPASTMYVRDLAAATLKSGGPTWTAVVTVTVVNNLGQPVSGVAVTGRWTAGASGSVACDTVTDGNGLCSARRSNIDRKVASVTFNVDGLTKSGLTYNSSANLRSSIVVTKP